MSWKLIRKIQNDTDLRLILPFGLTLELGDVISVGRDGGFTLQGSSQSLLGVASGRSRAGEAGALDLMYFSGKEISCKFRTAGEASSLFENLAAAAAGFDIALGRQMGCVLALTGRSLNVLEDVNHFRVAILSAYKRNVWKEDWALVVSIATAERMTLIASQTQNTKVALSLSGTFTPSAPLEAKLTAGASILATNEQIVHVITNRAMNIGCSAIRVQDPWWRNPYVSTLAATPTDLADAYRGDPFSAADVHF